MNVFLKIITWPFRFIFGLFRKKNDFDENTLDSEKPAEFVEPNISQEEFRQEPYQQDNFRPAENNKHELILSKLETINAKLDNLNERLKQQEKDKW